MDVQTLRFAKTHEWVAVTGETATIGITDFAVRQLTDLVHIELPKVGRKVQAGDTFGEVESVKAVSDLYAPVAGEISAVNNSLPDDLAVLSEDPFERGWLVRLKMAEPGNLSGLMTRQEYERFCAEEDEHA